MKRKTRKLTQKIIAVIVIVAMFDVVGVSPAVIIFIVGVGVLVWRMARRAERRETARVFDFFVSADDILRDEERQWYDFEVSDAISNGEQILNAMPDAPPLTYFALGALYHRVGDYESAVEHLAPVLDEQWIKERQRSAPSPQLRAYVELLRQVERDPALAPREAAAIQSLSAMRQERASTLLAESREHPTDKEPSAQHAYYADCSVPAVAPPIQKFTESSSEWPAMNIRPPISDVLHDVYESDKDNN
jgi:hypothetical protein